MESKTRRFFLAIFQWLFLLKCINGDTSCFTSVAIVGHKANVTCNFSENIGSLKRDFSVYKYPLGTVNFQDVSRTTVALCVWGASQTPDCHVSKDFVLGVNVSTTIIISIPNVTADAEGLYVCQQVQVQGSERSDPPPITVCNLTVTNATSSEDTEPGQDSGCNDERGLTGLNIGLIVLSVVLFVALVSTISFFFWKSRRENPDDPSGTEHTNYVPQRGLQKDREWRRDPTPALPLSSVLLRCEDAE